MLGDGVFSRLEIEGGRGGAICASVSPFVCGSEVGCGVGLSILLLVLELVFESRGSRVTLEGVAGTGVAGTSIAGLLIGGHGLFKLTLNHGAEAMESDSAGGDSSK